MNCEEFKKQTIVNIYAKQTPVQKNEFDQHILECNKCANIYKQTKSFSGVYEDKRDIPLPHWGKSWRVISDQVFKKKKSVLEFVPHHKTVFVVAVSLIIFVFRIFVGKQFFKNHTEIADIKTTALNIEESPLTAYAESLEMVLIDFRNQKKIKIQDDYLKLRHKLILEMLAQTEILKYIYSQENNE